MVFNDDFGMSVSRKRIEVSDFVSLQGYAIQIPPCREEEVLARVSEVRCGQAVSFESELLEAATLKFNLSSSG